MPKPDLTPLFDPETRADELAVLGIRLGDPAEKLRELQITAGEPYVEGMSIIFGTGGPWRELPDGTRKTLAIQEIIDLVIAHAGNLRADGTVFTVKDGHVTKIIIRDKSLDLAAIDSEEALLERFGNPTHRETNHRSSDFYYPDRSLWLVFDPRRNRLDAVGIDSDMSYDPPSRSDVLFGGGVVCRIHELRQQRTYEGLLEGVPTVERNNNFITHVAREAEEAFRLPVEVIHPRQEPIRMSRPYPFGKPAKIPAGAVTARFHCDQFARDKEMDSSCLAVVWFQEELALPIADDILEAIARIDWRKVAKDFEW